METITVFAETYPYLVLCFIFILFFIVFFLFFPGQRRPMLFSSFLFTPFALTAMVLVPVYWKPKLFWDLKVGVEDVIFCFFTGGTVWLLSVYCVRHRIILPVKIRPLAKRYMKYILYSSIAWSIFLFAGFGYLWSTLVALYTLGFMLLITQRRLWPLALWGATAFLGFYALILKIMFVSWPPFIQQWNLQSLSGLIFGLPVEELVWALGFGFTWPVFMAYVFDVQVRREVFPLD